MSAGTAITRMFGIRYPIIAAPMFLVSNPEMLIAVGEAGGMGAIPSLNCRTSEAFREAIRAVKAKTDAPYGVNLILMGNDRLEADLRICAEEKVPLIITSLGDPTLVAQAVHSYGGKVFCDVVGVRHARKAAKAGADALIAVASGAGGHAGGVSPFVLAPMLKADTGLPVVAAGAISHGAQMAAALALGADAAYVGTRFIASTESPVEQAFKQALVDAQPEDVEYTAEITGHPANFLRGSLEAFRKAEASGEDHEMKRWRDVWSAGHGVGLIQDIVGCGELVKRMAAEYEAARLGLPSFQGQPSGVA